MGKRTREDEINALLGEMQTYQAQLHTFMTQNQAIFDQFFDLINLYNSSNTDLRNSLRELDFPQRSIRVGPFTVTKATMKGYDPEVLLAEAPHVLTTPGVVKAVDKDAIDRLLAQGVLSRAVAARSYVEQPRSPSIKGPKPVEFKLG